MRFNIIWTKTGDSDKNITRAEVNEILAENDCTWAENGDVICNEKKQNVGYIQPLE